MKASCNNINKNSEKYPDKILEILMEEIIAEVEADKVGHNKIAI